MGTMQEIKTVFSKSLSQWITAGITCANIKVNKPHPQKCYAQLIVINVCLLSQVQISCKSQDFYTPYNSCITYNIKFDVKMITDLLYALLTTMSAANA
jgi:hypothetical protein